MYESSTMMEDSIQNDSLVLMVTFLGWHRRNYADDNFLPSEETRGKTRKRGEEKKKETKKKKKKKRNRRRRRKKGGQRDGILWRVTLYIMRVWLGRRLAAADGATERGQTLTGESRARRESVVYTDGSVYRTGVDTRPPTATSKVATASRNPPAALHLGNSKKKKKKKKREYIYTASDDFSFLFFQSSQKVRKIGRS